MDAAQTDFDNIVQYIAVHYPTAAEKLGWGLIDAAMKFTNVSVPRIAGAKTSTRSKAGPQYYVVPYRVREPNCTVEVLGFTHGARIE
ncbi:MAG: hypothetical protein JO279_14180 [Verrucomicrobia bacterium]|nr:hypothetical protein [Verrucomicrobiota bacterium]